MAEQIEERETLVSVVQRGVRNGLMETRTSFPGKIVSFDSETQTASVQPLIKATMANEEEVALPVLIDVPIMFPRAGGFTLTLPVETDDELLVTCCDRDFSVWLQNGDLQRPDSSEIHTLSSAVGILGLYNQKNTLEAFQDEGVDTRTYNRSNHILVTDSGVTIQSTQTWDTTLWNAATPYFTGQQVTLESGVTYIAVQNSTGVPPASDPSYWTEQPFSRITLNTDGTILVEGTLNVTGDVVANYNTTNISAVGHTHTSNLPGLPTSAPLPGV